MHIAIIEDDELQSATLSLWLLAGQHVSESFHTSQDFFDAAQNKHFDLIMIDWMLPDYHGGQVIEWVRGRLGWDVPIMVVTAREDEENIVTALRAGADDYMVKPVKPMELLARVEVLGRRFQVSTHQILHMGCYDIDRTSRSICVHGKRVDLTQKEFELAVYLFRNPSRLLSRIHLLEHVWGINADIDTRTVDTHVSRIRKKLDIQPANHWLLVPVYGYGYRMEPVNVA